MIELRAKRVEHRAFAAHLRKVSKALHDLEWVWSGDYGEGDEIPAIMACITKTDALDAAAESIRSAIADGQRLLEEVTNA